MPVIPSTVRAGVGERDQAAGPRLIDSPRRLVRRLRWRRFRAAPVDCVRRRMGLPRSRTEPDWRSLVSRMTGWPPRVRDTLQSLPPDFVSDWSFSLDSGLWLYRHVRSTAYHQLVECGSGLTTLLIATALRDRGLSPESARLHCLEHHRQWVERTRQVLSTAGLAEWATIAHAPLLKSVCHGTEVQTYDMSSLPESEIDFLLVDGPPVSAGRHDVIQRIRHRLAPRAVVVLDDAGRGSEQQCVERWTRAGWLRLEGYLGLGHGLALLRSQPHGLLDTQPEIVNGLPRWSQKSLQTGRNRSPDSKR